MKSIRAACRGASDATEALQLLLLAQPDSYELGSPRPRPQTLGEVESIEEAASTLARLVGALAPRRALFGEALHDTLAKHLWQRAWMSFQHRISCLKHRCIVPQSH